jgi:hypothetical protein
VVLVGEEEEAGEVPQGAAVLRKSETRPEVERRGLSLRSRRGRQSAAGKKRIALVRGVEAMELASPLDRSSAR